MSGAQAKAATISGCIGVIAEVLWLLYFYTFLISAWDQPGYGTTLMFFLNSACNSKLK